MYNNLFAVLNEVQKSHAPVTATAIEKETGMSLRTVQRMLNIWVKQGFIAYYIPRGSQCRLYTMKKP